MTNHTNTADHARAAEARAADHRAHGRIAEAIAEYRAAAAEWAGVADRLARHGETAISEIFRAEARKNERKADAAIWDLAA